MSRAKRVLSRLTAWPSALLLGAVLLEPVFAGDPVPVASPGTESATVGLINRLVERGVLSKRDSTDLLLMAEADAADVRAQAAMAQAALAQAAAAQARARALAAQLEYWRTDGLQAATSTPEPEAPAPAGARTVPAMPNPAAAPSAVEDLADRVPTISPPVAATPVRPRTRSVTDAESLPTQVARTQKPRASAPPQAEPEEQVPADVVRVTYIPENVKAQLREEVKEAVMDQARQENWAAPRTFPDWVTRIRIFGDLRLRYEGIKYPLGNDNTGSFPNFNAINTGAPFDVKGVVFSPQYNVDQDRNRARLRARVGATVDLGESFSTGLRIATGENNSPVSSNQSLGLPTAGQGGNFSKYPIWLDRAFLKYELVGKPDEDYVFSAGRFDNPFFATSMMWADDLGFDGLAVQGKFPATEDFTPFFTVGAFPVFNTDLNFASNQPAKFKSEDKWLYAAQLGFNVEFSKDFAAKFGAAFYQFRNIEGRLSSPFTPLTASDAGDTDATRPTFAQKGNTYMALRDITPNTLINNNGLTNQFQYFGLASAFNVMAFDARIDFNKFEPFQISLIGEYVKNRRFDEQAIAAKAVNNRGASATSNPAAGPFLGGDTGWLVGVTLGDAVLQKRWDWNVSFNYRKIESDAVVDGFVDSDFGGGGTNLKGFTLNTTLSLSPGVWLGLRWMSAQQIAGPTFKNDTFQVDVNARF